MIRDLRLARVRRERNEWKKRVRSNRREGKEGQLTRLVEDGHRRETPGQVAVELKRWQCAAPTLSVSLSYCNSIYNVVQRVTKGQITLAFFGVISYRFSITVILVTGLMGLKLCKCQDHRGALLPDVSGRSHHCLWSWCHSYNEVYDPEKSRLSSDLQLNIAMLIQQEVKFVFLTTIVLVKFLELSLIGW